MVLTDPRAYRVLAHGVRRQLLDVLGQEEQLTATQAARRIGITPSAMSYHLRALQKWGIVERVEPVGDAREHPWRLAAQSITFRTEGSPADRSAFVAQFVDELAAAATRASVEGGGLQLATTTAMLTAQEERHLAEQIEKLLTPFERRRKKGAAVPDGAREHRLFWVAARAADNEGS